MSLKDRDREEITDTYRMPSNYHDYDVPLHPHAYDMPSDLSVYNELSRSQNNNFYVIWKVSKYLYILIWAR